MTKLRRCTASFPTATTQRHVRTHREDQDRQELGQQRNSAARRVTRLDWDRRVREQYLDTVSRRWHRQDLVVKKLEQLHDMSVRRERRANPQCCMRERQMENTRRAQVCTCTQPCFNSLNYQPDNFISTTDADTLTVQCNHCRALKFMDETDYLCCAAIASWLGIFPDSLQ